MTTEGVAHMNHDTCANCRQPIHYDGQWLHDNQTVTCPRTLSSRNAEPEGVARTDETSRVAQIEERLASGFYGLQGRKVERVIADADLIANAPADLAFLLAELAKAQQENRSLLARREELWTRLLAVEDEWFALNAEVTSLRTALEGLPEEIARAIEKGYVAGENDGLPWTPGNAQTEAYNEGLHDATDVARSFGASRPTPAPEATCGATYNGSVCDFPPAHGIVKHPDWPVNWLHGNQVTKTAWGQPGHDPSESPSRPESGAGE